MSLGNVDHYAVLGVQRSADRAAIQAAYRVLARRHHPDFGGDEQAMARINEAWHVLGDAASRAAYDAAVRQAASPSGRTDSRVVLDFGRYAGWTLEDIAATDDDYLEWLARTPGGLPFRADIDRILTERRRALDALKPSVVNGRRAFGFR